MIKGILIFLICGFLAFMVVWIVTSPIEEEEIETPKYPSNCSNLSLVDSVDCVVIFVETFYNYTIREDTEKSVSDVIEHGGDCYDWTLFYDRIFLSLGFRTSIERFYTGDLMINGTLTKIDHVYLRIEHETGYCSVDATDYYCVRFKLTTNQTKLNNIGG